MRPRSVPFAAIFVAGFTLTVFADTYPRQPAIDVVHYRFSVTVSDDTPRIEGETTATLRLVAPARELQFDLASENAGKGMTVSRVATGGRDVPFEHRENRLRVTLPENVQPGTDLSFTIRYGGVPADGMQPITNMHGQRVWFSEGWPNKLRNWLPVVDHPSDKATCEMIVTAPADRQVVSNGVLVEELDLPDGRRRTHWKQSVPIATWLFAVGIARFDVHYAGLVNGVPLQSWVFPEDRETGRTVFEETSRRALEFFSNRIGPYPYEKLANVQAAGYSGGMENATTIFYGEKGVASGHSPVVHEIAHQWFGNSVTERDWDDVWLSEGFATYFALLYTEHYEGREAFVSGLTKSRSAILELEHKLPDTPVIHRNLSDMERLLNQLVYQKGGWVLHLLRQEIGVDAFWAGIREYYRRYRDRNASTDELRAVMEEAAGGKDLRWFFDQWLRRPGVPQVEGTWRYDAASKSLDITLEQKHPAGPFRLRADIGIVVAAGELPRVEHVALNDARKTYSMSLPKAPQAVVIDPETTLLADVKPLMRVQ